MTNTNITVLWQTKDWVLWRLTEQIGKCYDVDIWRMKFYTVPRNLCDLKVIMLQDTLSPMNQKWSQRFYLYNIEVHFKCHNTELSLVVLVDFWAAVPFKQPCMLQPACFNRMSLLSSHACYNLLVTCQPATCQVKNWNIVPIRSYVRCPKRLCAHLYFVKDDICMVQCKSTMYVKIS